MAFPLKKMIPIELINQEQDKLLNKTKNNDNLTRGYFSNRYNPNYCFKKENQVLKNLNCSRKGSYEIKVTNVYKYKYSKIIITI